MGTISFFYHLSSVFDLENQSLLPAASLTDADIRVLWEKTIIDHASRAVEIDETY